MSILEEKASKDILARLSAANREFAEAYPGDRADRQPVHTVYGGAHLFHANTGPELGEIALRLLDTEAPDPITFARALGIPDDIAEPVYERVREKLTR